MADAFPPAIPSPVRTLEVDALCVSVYDTAAEVALAASAQATRILTQAIEQRGRAIAIFATGRSQVQFLQHLTRTNLNWQAITGFHLDEYLGIAATHPASFRRYLTQHLTQKVSLAQWHPIAGDGPQPLDICQHYEQLLRAAPADLCCLGIGNNGHLAFNDPAVADFNDPRWVKLVKLDEQNRQQQADSSAFNHIQEVPRYAFTLTLSAIHAARNSLCLAYGEGKADVVYKLLSGPADEKCPASFLRKIPKARLLVDRSAAKFIS